VRAPVRADVAERSDQSFDSRACVADLAPLVGVEPYASFEVQLPEGVQRFFEFGSGCVRARGSGPAERVELAQCRS
jgi:hypothetical protein